MLRSNLQVSKSHYKFKKYSSERRFISYYHQFKNALELKPKRILLIGVGDNIVPGMLRSYSQLFDPDLQVKTFDLDPSLKPDYIGDVGDIKKIVRQKFDLIICCEVLEHLTFKKAIATLESLKELGEYLILSIPYSALTFRIAGKFPIFPSFDICFKIPLIRTKRKINKEHYWEIGTSLSRQSFSSYLERKGFKIIKSYLVKKHGSHYFYVLKSQDFDSYEEKKD